MPLDTQRHRSANFAGVRRTAYKAAREPASLLTEYKIFLSVCFNISSDSLFFGLTGVARSLVRKAVLQACCSVVCRALVRKPRVLLLDEATSALDAEAERQVQKTLDELVACGHTHSTVIVAHRLSTVKNASKAMRQNELA